MSLAKLKNVADNKNIPLGNVFPRSPLQGIALLLVIAVLSISLVSSGDFHFPASLRDSANGIQRSLPVKGDGPCLLCSICSYITGVSFCPPYVAGACEVSDDETNPLVSSDVRLSTFDVYLNRGPPTS